MVLPDSDHDCSLRPFLQQLAERLEKVEQENAQLKKSLYGRKSERSKMPRMKTGEPATPEQTQATRRIRAEAKAQTPTLRIEHKVPDPLRRCTACGRTDLTPMGPGKSTFVWEFVPSTFVRHEHVQEVLRCRCGGCVVTAPGAPKVVEKGQYGASFLAHIAVAKCADHLPIYRLEKELARKGVPVARSTMNELLHRTSALLAPIWTRLLDVIRARDMSRQNCSAGDLRSSSEPERRSWTPTPRRWPPSNRQACAESNRLSEEAAVRHQRRAVSSSLSMSPGIGR